MCALLVVYNSWGTWLRPERPWRVPSRSSFDTLSRCEQTLGILRVEGFFINLRTKLLDFKGFDSSIILRLRHGTPRPIGDFPESLSTAILVGIILVGRLGVGCWGLSRPSGKGRSSSTGGGLHIYIYIYIYICRERERERDG